MNQNPAQSLRKDLEQLAHALQRIVERDTSEAELEIAVSEARRFAARIHNRSHGRSAWPSDLMVRIIYEPVDPGASEECEDCGRHVLVMRGKSEPK